MSPSRPWQSRHWRRWLALGLVGLLVTLGMGRGAVGAVPPSIAPPPTAPLTMPAAPPPAIASAAELALPDPPEASTPGDAETLSLPEFSPRLPADALEPTHPMAGDIPPTYRTEVDPATVDLSNTSKRQQLLIAADEQYRNGDTERAIALYRQAKGDLWSADLPPQRNAPILAAADLPPAAAVYWREANAGFEQGLTHRIAVPLRLLVTEYPEFIPGQVRYAQYLLSQDQADTAAALLEQGLMLYPSQPDLLRAQTEVQMAQEKWIEASITARQFVFLNPSHPERDAMASLATANLERFRAAMNEQITQNFLGNLVTGTAGFLLTGGLLGPFTALNSAVVLMQGEDALGARIADQVKAQLPLLRDRPLVDYINRIGQPLADLAGRDEFDYDFYLIDDDRLNAFALPGGKIFINAGAVLKTHSEAELAGLLAHEIAHAVLSHGFQMATNSNFLSSLASFIPIPELANVAAGLAITGYSRQMERQADVLGTQILATGGYAADGLHNLMVTLQAEVGDRSQFQWFATHPAPEERVTYLQQIVETGGFNRYAYEGVAPHLAMQQRLQALQAARRHQATPPPTDLRLSPR